jgi:hypothetical protein
MRRGGLGRVGAYRSGVDEGGGGEMSDTMADAMLRAREGK